MSVRPNGIEVVENNHLQGDGGARSISFRTKPPVVTFYAALLCVALGYSGFMNLLHGMHWGIAALQFALALVAAYIVVRALFNRTFVRVASGVFTVSERPIPWPFKKRSLPVNEIVSIAAAERDLSNRRRTVSVTTYYVSVYTTDGSFELGAGLPDAHARFVADTLFKWVVPPPAAA